MSSSSNSNNNQPPQIPLNIAYNDYEDYQSTPPNNNLTINPQPSYPIGNAYVYPPDQIDLNNDEYDDDDIPSDFETELNATEEMMGNEQIHYNYEDEEIFSDDVQGAFDEYEKQFSKLWNPTKPTTVDNFTDEEQDEMFDQMRECMMYMTQEYAATEMPNELMENIQESKLNPDAAEFRPSWSTPAENGPPAVTSRGPSEVNKQGEQQSS